MIGCIGMFQALVCSKKLSISSSRFKEVFQLDCNLRYVALR